MKTEAKYPITFTRPGNGFVSSLHYNGIYSFIFANVIKIYHFKAKDSEVKPYPLSLGKISKDFNQ